MDRPGARWSLTGAEAILRLRGLILSGDFDENWSFLEAQGRCRNHEEHYQGGAVPVIILPLRPGRARFTIVK